MQYPLSRKIILYSSLFITAAIFLPRLLLVQRNSPVSRLLPFNIYEWIVFACVCFIFCTSVFYSSKSYLRCYTTPWQTPRHWQLLGINLLLVIAFSFLAGIIIRLFFTTSILPANGYLLRFLVCSVLIAIELKVMATVQEAQQKEREIAQLRTANAVMELELLKTQLNPHFFFNALSSLSAVVQEDPPRAQQYIAHLSKIFRYSLQRTGSDMTTVREELEAVYAYGELMKMRHESGFQMQVIVPADIYTKRLPHMSLQPLLENALKHNIAACDHPLTVSLTAGAGFIEVKNNLQPKPFPEPGAGIGLANLNERFRILLKQEIAIIKTKEMFIVKIPVQA